MLRRTRILLAGLVFVSSMSCGGSPTAPSVNLTGTWTGLLGESRSGAALRMSWVAQQTGNTVTGSAILVKPKDNVPAAGILSGTLSGTRITLTYRVPNGTVPGFTNCSISGSGTATATSASVIGTLAVTFDSCAGSGLEPTGSDQFELMRP